jgi:hypothetical protein
MWPGWQSLGGTLDVRISRNVISIPYRRLHFGQDV